MTSWNITPTRFCGTLRVPPSKSQTLRALLFAFLARGSSKIYRPLDSPDTEAMVMALRSFGAKVEKTPHGFYVEGGGGKVMTPTSIIDAGNSGLVFRFATALGGLVEGITQVTGDLSIQTSRPIAPLLKGLEDLGARVQDPGMQAWVEVQGKIHPGAAHIQGRDSQPVSALLIAAAMLEGTSTIKVDEPGETPWVELTLQWLRRFGVTVEHDNYHHYRVTGPLACHGMNYEVPGDFSSALFPAIAAIITGSTIYLEGLHPQEAQGDKAVFALLKERGVALQWQGNTLAIFGHQGAFLGGKIDVNPYIDALPALAVLACFAKEKTHLYNGAIARNKESDRIASIAQELTRMGAKVQELPDGMIITPSPLKGASVHSHHDHRIAMALAAGAMGACGPTSIADIACVAKTYPTFLEDIRRIQHDVAMA